jgi:hypothetical protein
MPETKTLSDTRRIDNRFRQVNILAKEIRGPFLEHAIVIERLIEDIISWHFCPDEERRLLLFSLVISEPDFTFSSKIEIIDKILKLHYPDLAKKYPKLVAELTKVRKFRNRIAHAMLDTSDDFLAGNFTDRIQLIYFEDGQTKHQVITTAERDERLKECWRLVMDIVSIQQEVIKRVSVSYTQKENSK